MSSSEEDFMSDKYITQPPPNPRTQTYAQRRALAAKRHLESQPKPRAVREEEARRKALETSLFEREGEAGGKAMGLMMKMGWKPGEGLGKKTDEETKIRARSPSNASDHASDPDSDDDASPVPGIGAKRRKLSPEPAPQPRTHRTEPLRISLWAGKSGLGTHQRSPSPENMSFLLRQSTNTPHGPGKDLDLSADEFRRRRAEVDDAKRTLARQQAARTLLMEFDAQKGIAFHPLWIIPSAPLETMPRPLIRLIDPETADTLPDDEGEVIRAGSDVGNVSAADRMREEMRRDALGELDDDEDELKPEPEKKETRKEETDGKQHQVDWPSFIPSVHRVLRMSPATHLSYLIDSLRIEHLYCFWCAARYGSVEEMDGPGGCPGTEEDDH